MTQCALWASGPELAVERVAFGRAKAGEKAASSNSIFAWLL